jgi:alpha-L-fucosidase 2
VANFWSVNDPKKGVIKFNTESDRLKFDANETGLTIAPGQNLDESHRHHAHLMAIYPLGLLSPDEADQKQLINKSLRWLETMGTRNWCGYSFTWAACIYARAKEADNAEKMLKIFSSNFCSSNSFHLNGDQKGGQYSSFTYRPFTLEGNFAFAQGVHEMLIQSYNGYIEIFPAVPSSWKNVGFKNLRTEGAFLVSAKKENAVIDQVIVTAEQGGELKLKLPFKTWFVRETIIYKNGYE